MTEQEYKEAFIWLTNWLSKSNHEFQNLSSLPVSNPFILSIVEERNYDGHGTKFTTLATGSTALEAVQTAMKLTNPRSAK